MWTKPIQFSKVELILFSIAVLWKSIFFQWLYGLPFQKLSLFAFEGNGDSNSYIIPAIISFSKLEWSRLPGYSVLLKVLNIIFGESYYLNVAIILQVFYSLLTALMIISIGQKVFSRKIGFIAGLIFFCLPITNYYEVRILTEVYTTFFIALSFYISIYINDRVKPVHFFLLGLILCTVFTFRPVSLLIAPFVLFILFYKNKFKGIVKNLGLYMLPLVLFEVFWISFNYKRFNEFILIAKSPLYQSYSESFHTYGLYLCGTVACETKEDWLTKMDVGPYKFKLYPFGEAQIGPFHSLSDAFTSEFNKATIQKLAYDLKNCRYCNSSNFADTLSLDQINQEIEKRNLLIERAETMRGSVIREHPFIVLESRLKPILLFFSHDLTGTPLVWSNDYFEDRSGYDNLMKHIYNWGFSLLIILGLPGLIITFLRTAPVYKAFFMAGLGLTFVYPLVFGLPEWRYIYSALPFLCLGVSYLIVGFLDLLKWGGKIT